MLLDHTGLNRKQISCPSSSWCTLPVLSYCAEGTARPNSAVFRRGTDMSPLLSFAVHANLLSANTIRKACAVCRRKLRILAGRRTIKWQWYREEKGVLERRQAWGLIRRCGTARAVLSNTSHVGLLETWTCLSTSLCFLKAKEEDIYTENRFSVRRLGLWFSKCENSFENNESNLYSSCLLIFF